jgi:hypothetical protein
MVENPKELLGPMADVLDTKSILRYLADRYLL